MARQVLSGVRSTVAPVRLPDLALDFWAAIYRDNPKLAANGLTFEAFIADPERHLHGTVRYQLSIAEQAALKTALRRSVRVIDNGRLIEKLRHHRHQRARPRYMAAKGGER